MPLSDLPIVIFMLLLFLLSLAVREVAIAIKEYTREYKNQMELDRREFREEFYYDKTPKWATGTYSSTTYTQTPSQFGE